MTSLLILLGSVFFAPSARPFDSLRTETIDGKLFVIHQVDQGETLFSLSRRYGCSIDDILSYNKDADAGLDIGQILRIPYVPHAPVSVNASGSTHTVNPGETLFSISRQYSVTVDDLKQWNNLTDNAISVGQVLVIHQPVMTTSATPFNGLATVHTVMQGETLYGISKQFNVSVSDLMEWNHLTSNALNVGQTLYLRQPDYQPGHDSSREALISTVMHKDTTASRLPLRTNDTAQTYPVVRDIKISEAVKGSQEVVESGLAELIEGTEGNRKYLALHRTVPVGTILKIRNEMNNREVFVRVIGKLPDTAQNNGLLIKISKSAYDRLGAIDPRFRVEITYYK